jgi:hypothetical protein
MSNNKLLNDLYYNSKTGLSNADKLYKKAIEQGLKVTKKEVKEFVEKQHVDQIFKPQKRAEIFSSIIADGIRAEYQMDIIIYDRYEYHKYKYILCIIDIHSRYANVKPMTNRRNETIMKNIIKIFDEMGKPKKISCDNEFATIEFHKYCIKNDIEENYSEPNDIQKNSIVERFNRTLAGYIKKLRLGMNNYDWPSEIPNILENYNTSYHRTIRNSPYNIFYKKQKNNQDIIVVLNKFKVNDKVRIKLKRTIFSKNDCLTYSKDVYTIMEKIGTGKYRLDSGKIYTAKNLRKVSDIVEYHPNDNNEQEKEHNETQKIKKINKILKKVGINNDLIVEGKRTRKKKDVLDL